MIRSLVAITALLAGSQVSAQSQTYESQTSGATATQPPLDPSCPPMDGKDEVLLPPLLDEGNTKVVFTYGTENMQVRLLIPKQYSTLKVEFDGATNPAAALDVNIETPSSLSEQYWTFDATTDPCNLIATSSIPWNEFRKNLGGINEKRYPSSVWYGTEINIETTFEFELKPETLLAEGDNPHHIQQHKRVVRNVIPFEIHFDLDLQLWAQVVIRSPFLRKASALLETSVLTVSPDSDPMATARLEFVTIIPSPIWLTGATIAVSDTQLAHGLTVEEIVAKRDCADVNNEAFCTQHWLVHVAPKKCDLNGIYTATMTGACNPASNNCQQPNPNTMDIVFDVTSDDYCGVSQTVELKGSLHLKPTQCNEYMKGFIVASSPQGAKISKIEILELVAAPTLEGQNFLTIFDTTPTPTSILSFQTSQPTGNQIDFQFEWRGKQLRCDVTAQVDATVRVEFEATGPYLLSAPSVAKSKISIASNGKASLLDVEDMHMFASARVAADPTNPSSGQPGTGSGNGKATTGGNAATGTQSSASIAAVSSVAVVGVAATTASALL